MSRPNVFIDNGYPEGEEFCLKFLSSRDFTVETLQTLTKSSRSAKKIDIASQIAVNLQNNSIFPFKILQAYARQSRMWLSLRLGKVEDVPLCKSPDILLREFGEDGWYGPIKDTETESKKQWLIRTYTIPYYNLDNREIPSRIRWSVIAEIGTNYVALFWNGFSCVQLSGDLGDNSSNPSQFPCWRYISSFFQELENLLRIRLTDVNLHQLVLHQMWDDYLNNNDYRWRHLRIRAEYSGVALNAHSAGVAEIDATGLQALSRELAKSALESLDIVNDPRQLNKVENALLRTLIKEWGTKSYEFSLEKSFLDTNSENANPKSRKLFKAHCYFGLKPNSLTQDSLQHLRCFSNYGGSPNVLKFILKELGL